MNTLFGCVDHFPQEWMRRHFNNRVGKQLAIRIFHTLGVSLTVGKTLTLTLKIELKMVSYGLK